MLVMPGYMSDFRGEVLMSLKHHGSFSEGVSLRWLRGPVFAVQYSVGILTSCNFLFQFSFCCPASSFFPPHTPNTNDWLLGLHIITEMCLQKTYFLPGVVV